MKVKDALREMGSAFTGAGIESPLLDAEVIVAHVLGVERYRLLVDPDRELAPREEKRVQALRARRAGREPVAYLTCVKEFYSLEFSVTPDVLIPRPETELLVDLAVYYAKQGASVLDAGTGSGAIAVALRHSRRDCKLTASDVSEKALAVARKNAARILGRGAVRFVHSDLFDAFPGQAFDLIVSNPPYVDPAERETLMPELTFEPEHALYAGAGGTAVVGRLIDESPRHLRPGGMLIMEIGSGMGDFVRERGASSGMSISVLNDNAGLVRVAVCKKE
jgi:release factor glutamine methyltransferase